MRSLGRGGSLGADAALASWLVVFLPATILAVLKMGICVLEGLFVYRLVAVY